MGIKKCTFCDKHWVMYGIVESLYCTSETNIILCVNYTGIKFFKKERHKGRMHKNRIHTGCLRNTSTLGLSFVIQLPTGYLWIFAHWMSHGYFKFHLSNPEPTIYKTTRGNILKFKSAQVNSCFQSISLLSRALRVKCNNLIGHKQ